MSDPTHASAAAPSPSDPPPDGQPPPNPPTPSGTATLSLPDGRTIDLPVLSDAAGALFVDVSRLYPTSKVCTLDVGFSSTASCASSITFIDGNKGILLYRGIPAEDIATHGDWADAAFLVLRKSEKEKREEGKRPPHAGARSSIHSPLSVSLSLSPSRRRPPDLGPKGRV